MSYRSHLQWMVVDAVEYTVATFRIARVSFVALSFHSDVHETLIAFNEFVAAVFDGFEVWWSVILQI